MSETNRTYRIKADVNNHDGVINIDTNLLQDYDTLDILSVKISSVDMYKLHNSNYGVVVGRVLANNGFGVPNAKLSIFISADSKDGEKVRNLYPFTNTNSRDNDGVRYNLLPDKKVDDCHQVVGTFPNKRYMLDNDVVLEVFDKYYKYTTRTNNGGDYLIMGVPVGSHTLHMDLDLSDCGILSQKPRDFVHKGYTIEQFENPTLFKTDKELSSLSQIFTQDQTINVQPFWGNESTGEQIGITRADINISFKFETTCVFMGSIVSDSPSNGITKKCMATENMGNMEELMTGEGTIEMIRKTPSGEIEEFQVKGTQLIDANGVWCYQIPMNLDYMMTDEYGNMVPTDDPEKGIPTRASVRFRISMQDNEETNENFYRAKVLVPHNPQFKEDGNHETYDYEFGTYTKDESFRDLFMDNVYSVKSYIPRFQKKKTRGWKDKNFTGIKSCNFHGNNNPIPYNNMRIKLPFMFTVMCAIIKCFIFLTGIFNTFISSIGNFLSKLGSYKIFGKRIFPKAYDTAKELRLNILSEGLCPDLENWFFAPMRKVNLKKRSGYDLMQQTLDHLMDENEYSDNTSIEATNSESEDEVLCITTKLDYLISCVEMNLAMEYKVINFDFYNDWINGMIYIPRFMYYKRRKRTFLGITLVKSKIRSCMDNTRIFGKTRRYTQQCTIPYKRNTVNGYDTFSEAENILDKSKTKKTIKKSNNYHKKNGFTQVTIFGRNGGICHEHTTTKNQNVYYMKPCEWKETSKVIFYATDIILLGSLRTCNNDGIPQAFRYLSSTSYIMPTNLALTNMETNGALYMNDKDTLCAGKSQQLKFGQENENDGIRLFNPSSGIAAELNVYAKTNDRNIDTQYEGNELSDMVPLTEAAGIAWNYTGPDQGKINEKQMYYPGGHFLGLTCTNSQTNIKSCVNLSRICELGVNMSQRIEDISEIKYLDDTGEPTIKYVNTIPTGFISANEINDEDFRTMFATLNQNRLCATKFNPETGYYTYDFDFVKPINFDGSFKKVVSNSNGDYNKEIGEKDIVIDEKLLEAFGIANSKNRPDNEGDTTIMTTQAMTNEDISLDYYRFRLGLDYKNLKNNDKLQKSRFLKASASKYYLPQYENSYYFYFGMKQGATAIDEFNRQFFSLCDTSKIVTGIPTMDLSAYSLEVCNGTGTVKVTFDNFELPLRSFYYEREVDNTVETTYLMGKNDDYKTQYTSIIDNDGKGLPFGHYTFYATDSNGVEVSKTIDLGIDIFLHDIDVYDFNVYDSNEWLSSGKRKPEDENIYVGGYAKINYIDVVDEYKDVFNNKTCIITIKSDVYSDISSTTKFGDNNNEIDIFVPNANTIIGGIVTPIVYHVYMTYTLGKNACTYSSSTPSTVTIYLKSFTVKDGKNVQLNIGFKEYNLYYTMGSSNRDDDGSFTQPKIVAFNEMGNECDVNSPSAIKYVLSSTTINFNNINYNGSNLYFGQGGGISSVSTNPYTIEEWVKSISVIKSTSREIPFSNNVFTDNDTKVLWGYPQNISDIYTGSGVCSTENEIPLNYSLDDDYSYHSTKVPYSSVAVDGNCVSGDFYGILKNGIFLSGSTNSCIGQRPQNNTGYVFKPLPDGDLEYYVCESNNISKHSTEYSDGVFYSSFYYPVNEMPFSVGGNFFVWGERFVYMPENKDADPEIKYEELAGKCEISVNGGIRYKNYFGAEGKNIDATNFPSNALTKPFTGNTISSMYFRGYFTRDDGEEEERELPAYEIAKIGTNEVNVAAGYTGQTDITLNISEGYPDIESHITNKNYTKEYYLSSLVQQYYESFSYEGSFSDYASYEYLPGEGIVAYFKNIEDNKIRTYRPGLKNTGTTVLNDFCKICYQAPNVDSDYRLIDVEDGDAKYLYIKVGSRKKPTYYVLARYIQAYEIKNGQKVEKLVHESRIGELCFFKIDYYRKSKFRLYYSFIKPDDTGDDNIDENDKGQLITKAEKYGSSYSIRGNLTKIIEKIYDSKKRANGIRLYMEPVYRRRILADKDWLTLINRHHEAYSALTEEQTTGYYYCVENRTNGDNITLYKIYPTFLNEVLDDEGIILSKYAVEFPLTKEEDHFILSGNNSIDYVTIKYEMVLPADTSTDISNSPEYAKDLDDAINRLKMSFFDETTEEGDGYSDKAINFKKGYQNQWLSLQLYTGFTTASTLEDYEKYDPKVVDNGNSICFSSDTTFYVTFVLKVEFIAQELEWNESKTIPITFYLEKETEGEILRVSLLEYQSYLVFFDYDENNYEVPYQNKEIIFENSGGEQSVKLGISTTVLERHGLLGYYKGIIVDKENGASNYPDNIIYQNNYTSPVVYNGIEYYCANYKITVSQGSKNAYDAFIGFKVDVPEETANFKNLLSIKVKKGPEGIWTEPTIIYYYIQNGVYDKTTIDTWNNNYNKNNGGIIYLTDGIKSTLTDSPLIVTNDANGAELLDMYVNGTLSTESVTIKDGQKFYVTAKEDNETWYNDNIVTLINEYKNNLYLKEEYIYTLKSTDTETSNDYTTNVTCKVLPYSAFKLDNSKIDFYTIKFSIIHNDGEKYIVDSFNYKNFIPKYTDFNGDELNLKCKFEKAPEPGLFYLTKYEKENYSKEYPELMFLGYNYGENTDNIWNSEITYDLKLKIKDFMANEYGSYNNLYIKKITAGDDFKISLRIDWGSLSQILFPNGQNTGLDAELTITKHSDSSYEENDIVFTTFNSGSLGDSKIFDFKKINANQQYIKLKINQPYIAYLPNLKIRFIEISNENRENVLLTLDNVYDNYEAFLINDICIPNSGDEWGGNHIQIRFITE